MDGKREESCMTKSILNVGIVGANASRAWAHDAHIPALKQMADHFRLEAVSARSQDMADAARAAFGAGRGFGDSLALVSDPEVDIVTVTVKVPEHRAVVLAALKAGKHVYCEWPLGRDLAEAEEMAAAVTLVSNVMIGLQALSSPAVRDAANLVRAGALGELRVLRVFSPTGGWSQQAPPHFAYLQDKRNGATLEAIAGGHTLAVIEHIVGRYIEVDARNSTLQKTVRIVGTDEVVPRTSADHMLVLGVHETGCVSTLEVTGGVADRPFSFELIGEKGTLKLTSSHPGGFQVGRIALETSVAMEASSPDHFAGLQGAPVNVGEAYLRFADDIAAGNHSLPDFAYALCLTRLLDAIDTASLTGRRQLVAATADPVAAI
jgi:predicted dehydrogenase